MNYYHLLYGAIIAGWIISVEYRLWANLRILSETLRMDRKREPSPLRAVPK